MLNTRFKNPYRIGEKEDVENIEVDEDQIVKFEFSDKELEILEFDPTKILASKGKHLTKI